MVITAGTPPHQVTPNFLPYPGLFSARRSGRGAWGYVVGRKRGNLQECLPLGTVGLKLPGSLFPDKERATVAWKWGQERGWVPDNPGRVSTFRERFQSVSVG